MVRSRPNGQAAGAIPTSAQVIGPVSDAAALCSADSGPSVSPAPVHAGHHPAPSARAGAAAGQRHGRVRTRIPRQPRGVADGAAGEVRWSTHSPRPPEPAIMTRGCSAVAGHPLAGGTPNEHVSTTNQDTQTLRRSIDRETSFERMPNGVLPGRWAVQAKVIAPPGTDCGQPQDRAAPLPCASSARPAAAMRGVKRPPAPRPSHQAPAAPRLSGPRARKR
jgi:hypothetical protein